MLKWIQDEVQDEAKWIKAMPLLESKEHRKTILQNIKSDIQDELEKVRRITKY